MNRISAWFMNARRSIVFLCYFLSLFHFVHCRDAGEPYGQLSEQQTRCELEGLSVGSLLADNYNSLDEETEWDARLHSDYLTKHLGFFGVITQGTWGSNGRTAMHHDAKELATRYGWLGQSNISESAYWGLADQWVYMMGDSTLRQVWATFASPSAGNNFERNSKEWTREHCLSQFPHRKRHPPGDYPEEGWSGKCGNNEVTCHLSGYGSEGKLTFDWKHFPWEDYDEWLFGDNGMWGNNITDTAGRENIAAPPGDGGLRRGLAGEADLGWEGQGDGLDGYREYLGLGSEGVHDHHHHHHHTEAEEANLKGQPHHQLRQLQEPSVPERQGASAGPASGTPDLHPRRPDVFIPQMGLHTCFHAFNGFTKEINYEYVQKHEKLIPTFMRNIKLAINRPYADGTVPTPSIVIISTSGRIGNPEISLDQCIWKFNRALSIEAHKHGFLVFEREEIERRLLHKSDSYLGAGHTGRNIKPNMHLAAPGPQIVATALLATINCMRREHKPERMKKIHPDGMVAVH